MKNHMKNRLFLLSGFLFCAMALVDPVASASEVVLYDQRRNMPAMVMNLPEGWTGNYEIHYPEIGSDDYSYVLHNPATGQWLQKFPMQAFYYCELTGQVPHQVAAALGNTRLTKPLNAFDVLQIFINYRQDQEIEVLSSTRDEQSIAETKATLQRLIAQSGPLDFDMGSFRLSSAIDIDNASALLEYEHGGTLFREHVSTFILYFNTNTEMRMMGTGIRETHWKVFLNVAGGPAANFDDPNDGTIKAIWDSARKTPQWEMALNKEKSDEIARKMQRDRDQNAIWQKVIENQRQIGESRQKVLDNRAQAQSNAFNKMIDVIAGVEQVESPYGGELKIDYSKNHAWVDRNGDLIYSDNNMFNPNDLPNSSGSYLKIR